MSLNQKIVELDHRYQAEEMNTKGFLRKRKYDQISKDPNKESEIDEVGRHTQKRKKLIQGFLDIGSSSWSMMLAMYFISLHKSADPELVQFNKESIQNMLTILFKQWNNNIPIERKFDKEEFEKILKQGFIESKSDEGYYNITEKGIKKAIALWKNAGILTEVSKKIYENICVELIVLIKYFKTSIKK